jgi:hypothetical protein
VNPLRRFPLLLSLLGILCFPGADLRADPEEVFSFPLNPETLPRYREVCAVLAEHPTVTGTFKQRKTIRRLDRFLDSEGNFIIDSHAGILWETLKPFPSSMAVGRDYLIQSVPGGSKTRLDAGGNRIFLRLSETLSAVFTGNAQRLQDNFENYFTAAGDSWAIGLIPRDTVVRNFADKIIILGDQVIRTIILYEQGGDTIRYELSAHRFPEGLTSGEKALFSPY